MESEENQRIKIPSDSGLSIAYLSIYYSTCNIIHGSSLLFEIQSVSVSGKTSEGVALWGMFH